jgi:hypothetical protein
MLIWQSTQRFKALRGAGKACEWKWISHPRLRGVALGPHLVRETLENGRKQRETLKAKTQALQGFPSNGPRSRNHRAGL